MDSCDLLFVVFFFFQAEDGIRDYKVTGVQTCALPISCARRDARSRRAALAAARAPRSRAAARGPCRPGPGAAVARRSQAVLLHLAGQRIAVDPEHLRRRADLAVGVRQHARDVTRFDFRERQERALGPVGEHRLLATEFLREVVHPQDLFASDDHGSLDDVPQLPNVPHPGVIAQQVERPVRDRVHPFAVLLGEMARVVGREQGVIAPVNEPFSWPNNSLSSRFSGIAAQLTATNGPDAIGPFRWIARAITSLPVPDSPCTSTVAVLGPTRAISLYTSSIAGLCPTSAYCPTAWDSTSGSVTAASGAVRTRRSARRKSSRRTGSERTSSTPSFSARSTRPIEGPCATAIRRGAALAPRSVSTHQARSSSAWSPSTATTTCHRPAPSWRTARGRSRADSISAPLSSIHWRMLWSRPPLPPPSAPTASMRNTCHSSLRGAQRRQLRADDPTARHERAARPARPGIRVQQDALHVPDAEPDQRTLGAIEIGEAHDDAARPDERLVTLSYHRDQELVGVSVQGGHGRTGGSGRLRAVTEPVHGGDQHATPHRLHQMEIARFRLPGERKRGHAPVDQGGNLHRRVTHAGGAISSSSRWSPSPVWTRRRNRPSGGARPAAPAPTRRTSSTRPAGRARRRESRAPDRARR